VTLLFIYLFIFLGPT